MRLLSKTAIFFVLLTVIMFATMCKTPKTKRELIATQVTEVKKEIEPNKMSEAEIITGMMDNPSDYTENIDQSTGEEFRVYKQGTLLIECRGDSKDLRQVTVARFFDKGGEKAAANDIFSVYVLANKVAKDSQRVTNKLLTLSSGDEIDEAESNKTINARIIPITDDKVFVYSLTISKK